MSDAATSAPRPASRWKPYPEYRDSGVEWLGKVPVGWEVNRLRHRIELNPSKAEIRALSPDEPVVFVPMEAVGDDGSLDFSRRVRLGVSAQGLTYFRENDVVVAKITPCFENGKAAVARDVPGGIALGTTELHALRCGRRISPEFLYFVVTSDPFRKFGTAEMYGAGGQKRVPESFVRNYRQAFPGVDGQVQLGAMLGGRVGEVQRLVAKKERLIELLREKRTSIVETATLRGLNREATMRRTGSWMGEIPAHWGLLRTKQVARLKTGHTPSRQHPEYWLDCTIPWFTLADVWQIRDGLVDRVAQTAEKISTLGLANSAACLLPRGTVMLSRTASVGLSAIMGVDMATSQDFVNWIPGPEIRSKYLLLVFRAMKQEFEALKFGSTHQTIYMPTVGQFMTPLPSLEEQDAIVEHVSRETAKIDALVARLHQSVELLREYRSALVSAAVTGKIDLRGEAA